MRHNDLVATVIVLVGLPAGTAGYFAGASSRPLDRRIAALETRALAALAIVVVAVVAAGVSVAVLGAR
jgi:hypothetical protein